MTARKPMLSQKSTLECRECGCEIGEMSVMFPSTVGDLKPQLELDPSHAALPEAVCSSNVPEDSMFFVLEFMLN